MVIKSFMMRNYNVVLDTVQRPHWTKSAAKKSKKPHAHAQNTKDASREEVGRRVAADVFDYLSPSWRPSTSWQLHAHAQNTKDASREEVGKGASREEVGR